MCLTFAILCVFYVYFMCAAIGVIINDDDDDYTVKTRSLAHLALIPYRVVTDRRTDRQTDRIPIANTRSQQYLPVRCCGA